MTETSPVFCKWQDLPKPTAAFDKLTYVPTSPPSPESKYENFHKVDFDSLNFLPVVFLITFLCETRNFLSFLVSFAPL